MKQKTRNQKKKQTKQRIIYSRMVDCKNQTIITAMIDFYTRK